MRLRAIACFIFLLAAVPLSALASEPCFVIRGRAILYRGDGFFAIWHVGTHHIFFPRDKQSADLVCRYFDCASPHNQPALFADFTVCPTEPYLAGHAQPVIVKKVEHPHVEPVWPPRPPRKSGRTK